MLEDYTGKTELVLFGDDFVRYGPYLEQGQAVLLTGSYKQKPYRPEYEFKLSGIALAENVKRQMTKQLQLGLDARHVQKEIVDFLIDNVQKNPGKSALRIIVSEPKNGWKASMVTMENGFEMNYDLIQFLADKPEIDVQITPA